MDHYKVLGVNRTATKEEIKEAFRKLAVQYHPDKHSQSPKAVRDSATLRFKQVSEAYEVLIDDRKRADYNFSPRSSSSSHSYNYNPQGSTSQGYYGYGYGSYTAAQNKNNYKYKASSSLLEVALRYFTTRAFLLNLTFAGALFGGLMMIDKSGETLWKMHNSGKSFEETMESLEKAKAHKDTFMSLFHAIALFHSSSTKEGYSIRLLKSESSVRVAVAERFLLLPEHECKLEVSEGLPLRPQPWRSV